MQLSLFQPPSPLSTEHRDHSLLKIRSLLSGKIPEPSLPFIEGWFNTHAVTLLITWGRKTKSGDFRPPKKGALPVISVNRTLNTYAFLITLVHEMAHFEVFTTHSKPLFLKRRRRISPHGNEWKEGFQKLMAPFLRPHIFPEEILDLLAAHMQNPRASTYSDPRLARVLMGYDDPGAGILMEELAEGSLFTTASGMLFRKEAKLRRRYRCMRVSDRKIYLFSPLARVFRAET